MGKGGIHEYGKILFDFERIVEWFVENIPTLRPVTHNKSVLSAPVSPKGKNRDLKVVSPDGRFNMLNKPSMQSFRNSMTTMTAEGGERR